MKKINIPKLLSIPIVILIIVLYIAIYTITSSNYVVEKNILIFVILGLFILIILGIIAIVKIYYKTEIKPEKALLFIMIPFCILILCAIPVGRGHDETIHWIKVFEISEGTLISPIDSETGISTAFLPAGVEEIVKERKYGEFRYVDNIPLLNNKLNYNERIKIENPRAESYCFIQYIPEVAGILIGKLITQNPLLLAYMARIGNIITCTIIMYFAIKLIPFGKNILLVLTTIPIAIEGFATISGDGITTSICTLFIAYTFYIAFDKNKKCRKKEVLILAIMGAVLSLCKIVYMPLIFLTLIIPKDKFKNKKSKMISILIIIILGMVCNFMWLGLNFIQTTVNFANTENDTIAKILTIITNPIGYIQRILYTIGVKGSNYFITLFGGQLEWNETVKIEIIPYAIGIIATIIAMSQDNNKYKLTKFQKTIILLIVLTIILLVFTALYTVWSNNRLNYIDGVQGRYFLPILPLILILISNLKVKLVCLNRNGKEANLENTKNYEILSEVSQTKLICISGIMIQLYTVTALLAEHL